MRAQHHPISGSRLIRVRTFIDMKIGSSILLLLSLFLTGCGYGGVSGQVQLAPSDISANRNDVDTVEAEINTPAFRALLANAAGVGEWRLRRQRISLGSSVASWTSSTHLRKPVASALSLYLSCRAEGHSSAYCRDALAAIHKPSPQYAFLNDLHETEPRIPEGWISRIESRANAEGGRVVAFVVLDGELAWSYALSYRPDGQLKYSMSSRVDAVEFNPGYTNVIAKVDRMVEDKMKAEGTHGEFGSVHSFWKMKKEMLQERGIRWRTPSELNPTISYD